MLKQLSDHKLSLQSFQQTFLHPKTFPYNHAES